MRVNKYLAAGGNLSRRAADTAIAAGRVTVNGQPAQQGQDISETDRVTLDSRLVKPKTETITVMLNKPRGYVVSRDGQGSRSMYDLLPRKYRQLNPIGRLDKDSSGLLLLTNDGQLAHELTHPSRQKIKIYEVTLDKPLQPLHHQMISEYGLQLEDGLSMLHLEHQTEGNDSHWIVSMREGRNRQIRRTFAAVDYTVTHLHRTHFGPYELGSMGSGSVQSI